MSIYKRKESWRIQFTTPDGRRIQQTAGTKIKQEAQELHDRFKAEAWRVKNFGVKPRHTWQEAVIRCLSESSHKKSIITDKVRLRWVDSHLHHSKLDEITKTKIETIKSSKLNEGASHATVNRTLALLRSILKRAKDEWEWLDSTPSIRLFPEIAKGVRWLSQEETDRLIHELPEHLGYGSFYFVNRTT